MTDGTSPWSASGETPDSRQQRGKSLHPPTLASLGPSTAQRTDGWKCVKEAPEIPLIGCFFCPEASLHPPEADRHFWCCNFLPEVLSHVLPRCCAGENGGGRGVFLRFCLFPLDENPSSYLQIRAQRVINASSGTETPESTENRSIRAHKKPQPP